MVVVCDRAMHVFTFAYKLRMMVQWYLLYTYNVIYRMRLILHFSHFNSQLAIYLSKLELLRGWELSNDDPLDPISGFIFLL